MAFSNLVNYVTKRAGRYELVMPLDLTWKTNGDGLWSRAKKPVKVTQLLLHIYDTGQDLMPEDLQVRFDTATWGVYQDGLIYSDTAFVRQLRQFLVSQGTPAPIAGRVDYSEQGMQGDDYVSCDAFAFGEFIVKQFRLYQLFGDSPALHKKEIIKSILTSIKSNNTVFATAVINELRERDIAWEELDVIERKLQELV